MDIRGGSAIVTGGASGLGEATVRKLAAAGAKVVIVDRDATRGAAIFKDAQCISCHRFGSSGEGLGPDLTKVSNRFQRKEILESIVYPSHVVSDQYASHVVIADGKTYIGITARNADGGTTVLQSDGKKVQLAAEDIEDIQPSKQSAMPEGLLNRLSLEQVADLFAFLTTSPDANVATRKPSSPR